MARVAKRKDVANDKIKMNFDVPILNAFIKFCRCDYVPHGHINQLCKLMNYLDLDTYKYNPDIYNRIKLILFLTDMKIGHNISDEDVLLAELAKQDKEVIDIFNNVGTVNQLAQSDCEYIANAIRQRNSSIAIFEKRNRMIYIMEHIDGSEYETSFYSLMEELKRLMSELLVSLQANDEDDTLIRSFSFSDDKFVDNMNRIVKRSKRPSSVLQTGIRQLNAILSPGFQSGRFYLIVGGSGKFKSGTLLNITDQIRQYNPFIIPYENGRRKTILFITMENSIEETIERLYDMYSDVNSELRDGTTKDVIECLRREGKFTFNDTAGIDIDMRYYGNLEITTAEIYSIIRELNDNGKEPIAIVLDYVKRIDSAKDSHGDERVRLSYVGKELKNIAQNFQIPVISAMQLNREGNSIIDSNIRENKSDVARFVGSSNIGNAWDLIEDADWVALINLEKKKSTNQLYLTWKRLKIRGKKIMNAVDYFNHPFVNEKNIRLACDVDLPEPLSIISLNSDLESIDEAEDEDNKHKKYSSVKSISERKSSSVMNQIKSIKLDSMLANNNSNII